MISNDNLIEVMQGVTDKIMDKVKNIYSTTETVVGRWIDGKPIYRKVLTVPSTTLSASDPTDVNFDTTDLHIDTLISSSGQLTRSDNVGYILPLGFLQPAIGTQKNYSISHIRKNGANKINFVVYWGESTFKLGGTVVIEYTKTTD